MGICTYCISKAVIYMDMHRSSLAGMLLGCKLNFELSSKLIHWILVVLHLCTYYWVLCSDWWKDQCMHPNIYLGYWDLAPVPIDQCQDFLFLLTTLFTFHDTETENNLLFPLSPKWQGKRHSREALSWFCVAHFTESLWRQGWCQQNHKNELNMSIFPLSVPLLVWFFLTPPLSCFPFPPRVYIVPKLLTFLLVFSILILKFISRLHVPPSLSFKSMAIDGLHKDLFLPWAERYNQY